MPPPTVTTAQPDLGANQEGARRDEFLSVRTLSTQARKIASDLDVDLSGSRIRTLVRRFVSDGRADIDFRTWFIGHADPTGETAVRNVTKTRGY